MSAALAVLGKQSPKLVIAHERRLLRALRKRLQASGDTFAAWRAARRDRDLRTLRSSLSSATLLLLDHLTGCGRDAEKLQRVVRAVVAPLLAAVDTPAQRRTSSGETDSNGGGQAGKDAAGLLHILRWLCRLFPSEFWRCCCEFLDEAAENYCLGSALPQEAAAAARVVHFFLLIAGKVTDERDCMYSKLWQGLVQGFSMQGGTADSEADEAAEPPCMDVVTGMVSRLAVFCDHQVVASAVVALCDFACTSGTKVQTLRPWTNNASPPVLKDWGVQTFSCLAPVVHETLGLEHEHYLRSTLRFFDTVGDKVLPRLQQVWAIAVPNELTTRIASTALCSLEKMFVEASLLQKSAFPEPLQHRDLHSSTARRLAEVQNALAWHWLNLSDVMVPFVSMSRPNEGSGHAAASHEITRLAHDLESSCRDDIERAAWAMRRFCLIACRESMHIESDLAVQSRTVATLFEALWRMLEHGGANWSQMATLACAVMAAAMSLLHIASDDKAADVGATQMLLDLVSSTVLTRRRASQAQSAFLGSLCAINELAMSSVSFDGRDATFLEMTLELLTKASMFDACRALAAQCNSIHLLSFPDGRGIASVILSSVQVLLGELTKPATVSPSLVSLLYEVDVVDSARRVRVPAHAAA